MNSCDVWLTKYPFPLIGPLEIYSLIISFAPLLDNYIGYEVSHSLIKGHLGVEIVIFSDIAKREFGQSLVNIISFSFDWALRNN